ncbi:Bloom syndrome protein homolog [Gigantopelta aegis]|uniref:Bloom syndrome protein homolog n=1 Tax=Gigantopelta aegis TaxID=1735272 RepID=UPI001B88E2F5|nr:Bloom syndrome protein homolog [Gigantopelta aegis]
MSDQCRKLTELDFRATYILKDVSETEAIQRGYFEFVFGSPEMLVSITEWRDMLKSTIYQDRLKMIVVDETHTVIQWGLASGTDAPFREWFSKIGEIRSLFPKAVIAALTATTPPIQRRKIMKSLCFGAN